MALADGDSKHSVDSATMSVSEWNLSRIIHHKKLDETAAYWQQLQVGAPGYNDWDCISKSFRDFFGEKKKKGLSLDW